MPDIFILSIFRRFKVIFLSTVFLFLLVFSSVEGWADVNDHILKFPLQPANTSSPEETLESFISSMNKSYFYIQRAVAEDKRTPIMGLFHTEETKQNILIAEMYFNKALECLDRSGIPKIYLKDVSYETALQLKEILDRINIPSFEDMQSTPFFKVENNNKLWRIPRTEIKISMITEGKDAGEYLFTSGTMRSIKSFYERTKYLPYKDKNVSEGFYKFYIHTPGSLFPPRWVMFLPEWSKSSIADQTIWQWCSLFAVILLFTSIYFFVYKVCKRAFQKSSLTSKALAKFIFPLAIVMITILMGKLIDDVINITGALLVLVLGILNIIRFLSLGWGVFLLGGLFAEVVISSPKVDPASIDASLVRTLSRLISLFMGLVVLIDGASSMGISLVPIITSLGVVGLALSLAAKPTLENIIGGITLFADKTVRIGEFCKFGNISGTVIHIGIRSTRIRALDRTIVSIPNGDFSQLTLNNISRRDQYPFKIELGVRYETTMDQMKEVISGIRDMLFKHPKISKSDNLRVFFDDFGESSLNIKIRSHVNTKDLKTFLSVKEELLFEIMKILEDSNVSLAFPSQTNYWVTDSSPQVDL